MQGKKLNVIIVDEIDDALTKKPEAEDAERMRALATLSARVERATVASVVKRPLARRPGENRAQHRKRLQRERAQARAIAKVRP